MSESVPKNQVFTLRESALVRAPLDRCFLLSSSVDIVHRELGMYAVAGRVHGLATEGDIIEWEGWQLGFWHIHVSQIQTYRRPHFFQDKMLDGRFEYFEHDHHLSETPEGTLLEDELRFSLPFGFAGRLVARFIMVPHIRGLMRRRFALLKRIAETDEWRDYIPAHSVTLASVAS